MTSLITRPEDRHFGSPVPVLSFAAVFLAVPGQGGSDLSPFAVEHLPFMNPDFSGMATPGLVVAGDRDQSRLTSRGPDWWADAYVLSCSPKALLTLFGAEHSLGGIPGYEAAETTDQSPELVAAIQRISTAYLRSALYPDDPAWLAAQALWEQSAAPAGRVDSKRRAGRGKTGQAWPLWPPALGQCRQGARP